MAYSHTTYMIQNWRHKYNLLECNLHENTEIHNIWEDNLLSLWREGNANTFIGHIHVWTFLDTVAYSLPPSPLLTPMFLYLSLYYSGSKSLAHIQRIKFKMVHQGSVFALAQWISKFLEIFHKMLTKLKTEKHDKQLIARHYKCSAKN